MCFYDFSFIITLIRYSHCANYIDVGVFFPYISVKILCDLWPEVPLVKIWDVLQWPERHLWPPPHTSLHRTHKCTTDPVSVSESVQPVLPTCSPLLDWDPMRTCVCVAVSRHTVYHPSLYSQHSQANTNEPWPEKSTDPSTLHLAWPQQSAQVKHRAAVAVTARGVSGRACWGSVCEEQNHVWEWVRFQSDPGVGSLFAHVNSVIVDDLSVVALNETIALLLPWPSHFLQPC